MKFAITLLLCWSTQLWAAGPVTLLTCGAPSVSTSDGMFGLRLQIKEEGIETLSAELSMINLENESVLVLKASKIEKDEWSGVEVFSSLQDLYEPLTGSGAARVFQKSHMRLVHDKNKKSSVNVSGVFDSPVQADLNCW